MPDLPNRTDEETALADKLDSLFAKYRAQAKARLGDPPSIENIPVYYWTEIANEIAREIQPTLERIHKESAARFDKLFSITGRREQHAVLADVWSNQRAYVMADDLAARIRDSLAVAVVESNHDWLLLLGAIGLILGSDRAERIAVTELTGAVSAGELTERRRVQAAMNAGTLQLPKAVLQRAGVPVPAGGDGAALGTISLTIVAYWQTENDNKVCPLCSPLHDQPEDIWARYYPQGPGPGGPHPNCRCWLRYELGLANV